MEKTLTTSPMNENRKQFLDDAFDAFTMLAGGNFVSLYDIKAQMNRYSKGAVEVFNLPGEYVAGGPFGWEELVHPNDRLRYRETMKDIVSCKSLTYDITYRTKTNDGSYSAFRYIGAVIRDSDGNPSLLGGMIVNAGRFERTDSNTMLPNQDAFFNDLATLHLAAKESVLLLIGISQLSRINREYSYSYGNSVLQQIAWLLQEETRGIGNLYRLSGSRFGLITRTAKASEVIKAYKSISRKLCAGIAVGDNRQPLSPCGGLVTYNDFSRSTQAIFACLVSVYRESKYRRDGELVIFDSAGSAEADNKLKVLNLIHNSMVDDCKGFFLEYQPVLNMHNNKIVALESLVRWQGVDGTIIYPYDFIPVLEVDLAYDELGYWILRHTMLDGVRFLKHKPDLLLGVNVVASQIRDPFFLDAIVDLVKETQFPLANLCLELNSNARQMTFAILQRAMEKLRSLKIRLAMDDFGTGFGSIQFLEDLEWDYIKCDKKFTTDLLESKKSLEILVQLKRLTNIFGLKFCVKGIHDKKMVDLLLQNDIIYMQGFGIQHAMSANHIEKLLEDRIYIWLWKYIIRYIKIVYLFWNRFAW